jgi:hypothetical protein
LDTIADQDDVPEKVFATCPFLCRKADVWSYVTEEPRYLADDHELSMAFSRDIWILDVPSRLRTAVEKYLGVSSLSRSVNVEIVTGEPMRSLERGLAQRFAETLPYVFAWRSAQTKQDGERLLAQLTFLKVKVVPVLTARLVLGNISTTIERLFAMSEGDLLLAESHINESSLGQALAEALGAKTEADFYENLLRCNEATQRKEKLLAKGIPETQVDRYLRDYSGQPPAEVETGRREREVPSAVPPAGTPPGPPPSLPESPKPPVTPEPIGPPPGPPHPDEPIQLKAPDRIEYVVGTDLDISWGGGGGSGGGGGEGKEGWRLSDDEKKELERCARAVARRELEKGGYVVEVMPFDHPGYDLRGRKDGEERRVEVKGHLGRATVVDLTSTQYRDYLGSSRVGGGQYTWELWNVEHLDQDDLSPVSVTKYSVIPDEALNVRTFRVDLKQCQ